jgi:hypothetical protein
MVIRMGEIYSGTFILDDSQAQGVVNKTDRQLATQERVIQNNRNRLETYFGWAMHMAHVWANYIAHNLEGTALGAKLQEVQTGLNIASAELSIALTTKRGLSDIATGNVAPGMFQLALAGSMQVILLDMERQRRKQQVESERGARMRQMWAAYR